MDFLVECSRKSAFFVIRQPGNTPYKRLTELKFVGKSTTGEGFEPAVEITAPQGATLQLRRVVVKLNTPTRKGDKTLILLTDLPEEPVEALTIADRYRARWGIETAFQKLERHLNSEINTLGYPKAALVSFCLALGPKKPRLERNQFKGHPHVLTAKLLKGITPKVVAGKAALNDLKMHRLGPL